MNIVKVAPYLILGALALIVQIAVELLFLPFIIVGILIKRDII